MADTKKKILEQWLAKKSEADRNAFIESLTDAQMISIFGEADKMAVESPSEFADYSQDLSDLFTKIASTPQFKSKRFREELSAAISDGAQLYDSIANMITAKGQVELSEEALSQLKAPAIPSVQPKSTELAGATETARRRLSGRAPEIDPILQRNLDMLQKNLGVAKTASTGQAGTYGVLGQQAVNEARRANIDAIPAIEGIRRQDQATYNQLLGQGLSEDSRRFGQGMQVYNAQNRRYETEARAAGQLGAVGRANQALARQGLTSQLGKVGSSLFQGGQKFAGLLNNIRGGSQIASNQLLNPKGSVGLGVPMNYKYEGLRNLDPSVADYGNLVNQNLEGYFNV